MPIRGTDQRGFSLIEMMVALVILGVVARALVSFFSGSQRMRATADVRLETHQALQATTDSLARDLRLAGVCLPKTGSPFLPLAGVDSGTADRLLIRYGTTSNLACVIAHVGTAAVKGTHTLVLNACSGTETFCAGNFSVGSEGYVGTGSGGDFFTVISKTGNTLTTTGTWSQAWAAGSEVYPVQERLYALDSGSLCGSPGLLVARDRAITNAQTFVLSCADRFATGITQLDIRYKLVNSATPVSLPADAAAWSTVNEVLISVTSRQPLPGGANQDESTQLTLKPRNLQP